MKVPTFLHAALLGCLAACSVQDDSAPASVPETPSVAPGIYAPMGNPLPSATPEQRVLFEQGLQVARRPFGVNDGLGPGFNAATCVACHSKPAIGGSSARYRDFYMVEFDIEDVEELGVQVLPRYDVDRVRTPTHETATHIVKRNAPAIFGTGLLQEITEAEILSHADPDDADGDGISGRANYERGELGRFGSKAHSLSVEEFTRAVLSRHQGISSDILPLARKAELPVPLGKHMQAAESDDDGIPDPEMSEDDLFALVSYVMLLAAPEPDEPTALTTAGGERFVAIGCSGCHLPTIEAPRGPIPAFTDLLIHDMGPELADGLELALASGSEFRTPPLWGVAVSGPWMHDGRADSLDAAIRWHGGEAQRSREAYEAMPEAERQSIVAFLESLGGRDLLDGGTIRSDESTPSAGAPGGPAEPLSSTEAEMFARGRVLFDRNMTTDTGLGPAFNGDSCRACHSLPAVGGAGSPGVDVVRHGIVGTDGIFRAPDDGTMVPHFFTDRERRPEPSPGANVFEARQAPSLFGLGLLDAIPEDAIVALADPDDGDGDGISGRAHRLPDGRLGRLGWKANVPNALEFLRDAMTNEMGITLPAVAGASFGAESDTDSAPDPELSRADFDALLFFLTTLGPPRGESIEPSAETQGESVFLSVGCAGCHTPRLYTAEGTEVAAYTDLLLHEMYPPGTLGIATGDASMVEYRTPPLWGIGSTAPYLHDGRAATIEEAILGHDGEAAASREQYLAFEAQEREALIAFLKSL